jgi:hypothetical protein
MRIDGYAPISLIGDGRTAALVSTARSTGSACRTSIPERLRRVSTGRGSGFTLRSSAVSIQPALPRATFSTTFHHAAACVVDAMTLPNAGSTRCQLTIGRGASPARSRCNGAARTFDRARSPRCRRHGVPVAV